ncbi:TlpA disulfide reductase family protein [Mucilaginibacter sp. PAMB04274]|uniref:TlpA family protein disulfide reductase n=1 Tax=Mucilaginibacter sp. PAMB04274 TaxID=3138568 RepID=UPI0031F70869
MKKITKYIVLAVLCLNFSVWAQVNQAVGTAGRGIRIGQPVPDITLTGLIHYKDRTGHPAGTAKLADFKGKLLILDFWATWCSPCIAMIPRMDSLQKRFDGQLQFLSVTYQSANEVNAFMAKFTRQQHRTYDIPELVGDKALNNLFPHSSLPHFVWIDPDGIVRAITDQNAVNMKNINNLLLHQDIKAPVKQDVALLPYDRTKPLFTHQNSAFDSTLIFRSSLTGCVEGLRSGYHYDLDQPGKSRRITTRNVPLMALFSNAYAGQYRTLGNHKILLDVQDTTALNSSQTGAAYHQWLFAGHGYCYELIVPPRLAPDIFSIMQSDLSRLFPQYKARVELLDRDCWVLTRTAATDKLKTTGSKPHIQVDRFGFQMSNATLDYLIVQLDSFYLSNTPYPVVDGTGYTGKVDLSLDANLGSIESLNQALEKYDLKFVLKKAPIEMLHISDNDKAL